MMARERKLRTEEADGGNAGGDQWTTAPSLNWEFAMGLASPAVVMSRPLIAQLQREEIIEMKRKWHGARALLNTSGHSSTGAIVCEIEDSAKWKNGKDGRGNLIKQGGWVSPPDYTFQIANCDRSIAFELDLTSDPDDLANNLFKIDTMIDTLQKFRDGVALEQQRHKDRIDNANGVSVEIL